MGALIVIVVVYLAVGVVYTVRLFGLGPLARPVGTFINPTRFFLMTVFLWPVSLVALHSRNAGPPPSEVPLPVRHIDRQNVVEYLRQHPLSSLPKIEIYRCQQCLSEIKAADLVEFYIKSPYGGKDGRAPGAEADDLYSALEEELRKRE